MVLVARTSTVTLWRVSLSWQRHDDGLQQHAAAGSQTGVRGSVLLRCSCNVLQEHCNVFFPHQSELAIQHVDSAMFRINPQHSLTSLSQDINRYIHIHAVLSNRLRSLMLNVMRKINVQLYWLQYTDRRYTLWTGSHTCFLLPAVLFLALFRGWRSRPLNECCGEFVKATPYSPMQRSRSIWKILTRYQKTWYLELCMLIYNESNFSFFFFF